jgi:hypothetical protein
MRRETPALSAAAQDIADSSSGAESKSSAAWMILAWTSFAVWLVHSFAVRSFLDSLHVLGRVLGTR